MEIMLEKYLIGIRDASREYVRMNRRLPIYRRFPTKIYMSSALFDKFPYGSITYCVDDDQMIIANGSKILICPMLDDGTVSVPIVTLKVYSYFDYERKSFYFE